MYDRKDTPPTNENSEHRYSGDKGRPKRQTVPKPIRQQPQEDDRGSNSEQPEQQRNGPNHQLVPFSGNNTMSEAIISFQRKFDYDTERPSDPWHPWARRRQSTSACHLAEGPKGGGIG